MTAATDIGWVADNSIEGPGHNEPPKNARDFKGSFQAGTELKEIAEQHARIGCSLMRVACGKRDRA